MSLLLLCTSHVVLKYAWMPSLRIMWAKPFSQSFIANSSQVCIRSIGWLNGCCVLTRRLPSAFYPSDTDVATASSNRRGSACFNLMPHPIICSIESEHPDRPGHRRLENGKSPKTHSRFSTIYPSSIGLSTAYSALVEWVDISDDLRIGREWCLLRLSTGMFTRPAE